MSKMKNKWAAWKREHRTKPNSMSQRTCEAIQYSDEMFCARCGLRWDVNDETPCKESEG